MAYRARRETRHRRALSPLWCFPACSPGHRCPVPSTHKRRNVVRPPHGRPALTASWRGTPERGGTRTASPHGWRGRPRGPPLREGSTPRSPARLGCRPRCAPLRPGASGAAARAAPGAPACRSKAARALRLLVAPRCGATPRGRPGGRRGDARRYDGRRAWSEVCQFFLDCPYPCSLLGAAIPGSGALHDGLGHVGDTSRRQGCRHIEACHANPAVGHPIVDVEAVR